MVCTARRQHVCCGVGSVICRRRQGMWSLRLAGFVMGIAACSICWPWRGAVRRSIPFRRVILDPRRSRDAFRFLKGRGVACGCSCSDPKGITDAAIYRRAHQQTNSAYAAELARILTPHDVAPQHLSCLCREDRSPFSRRSCCGCPPAF